MLLSTRCGARLGQRDVRLQRDGPLLCNPKALSLYNIASEQHISKHSAGRTSASVVCASSEMDP